MTKYRLLFLLVFALAACSDDETPTDTDDTGTAADARRDISLDRSGDDDTGDTGDADLGDANTDVADAPDLSDDVADDADDDADDVGDAADGNDDIADADGDAPDGDDDTGDVENDTADVSTGPRAPRTGDLVLVEIQGNPQNTGDNTAEWLEWVNVSNAQIQIQGCTLAYRRWDNAGSEPAGSEATFEFTASLLLEPGQRFVMARSGNPGGFDEDLVYDNFVINNGDGFDSRIRLYTPDWTGDEPPNDGELVDHVTIPGLTFENENRGRSWQLTPPDEGTIDAVYNDAFENWCSTCNSESCASLAYTTGNYGTPQLGYQCTL